MRGQLAELMARHAFEGRVDWIGVRSARLANMNLVSSVFIGEDGLEGDHSNAGKRAVTLIQAEHLPVIASLVGHGAIAPEVLRRNVVVSGINLTALRNHVLRVGQAALEITVPCAPCSRMEAALGRGGYNAVRGHGGWCARVVEPGQIAVNDAVSRSD